MSLVAKILSVYASLKLTLVMKSLALICQNILYQWIFLLIKRSFWSNWYSSAWVLSLFAVIFTLWYTLLSIIFIGCMKFNFSTRRLELSGVLVFIGQSTKTAFFFPKHIKSGKGMFDPWMNYHVYILTSSIIKLYLSLCPHKVYVAYMRIFHGKHLTK